MPIGYFNRNPRSLETKKYRAENPSASLWSTREDTFFVQKPDGTYADINTGQSVDPLSLMDTGNRDVDPTNVYDPESGFQRADNPEWWNTIKGHPSFGGRDFADVEDIYSNPALKQLNTDAWRRYAEIVMPETSTFGALKEFGGDLAKFFGPTIGIGMGMAGLAGGAGAGSGAGWTSGFDLAGGGALEGMGGGSLGAGLGGSNVSGFFEDILGDWIGSDFAGGQMTGGGNFMPTDFGGFEYSNFSNPFSNFNPNDVMSVDYGTGGEGTGLLQGEATGAGGPSMAQQLQLAKITGQLPTSLLKQLMNSGPGGQNAAKSFLEQLGIDPSDILGSGLNLAASVGPGLAAINYARNLGGSDTGRLESLFSGMGSPDTSRLQSAYNSIDPNALAFPYDIQTGKGRESLTSSLSSRGVMGSSFGDQDLSSYDTMRGLGRQNLLTQGAGQQANIANQILGAQQFGQSGQVGIANSLLRTQQEDQKQKLDLYGRALLALSGGLNPARSGAF